MDIDIEQTSTYHSDNWWEWSIWLEAKNGDLSAIDHVVYTLHPTFPNPVQRRSDPSSNFRLTGSGWGEFMIHIDISWKDGHTEHREHWLRLKRPVAAHAAVDTEDAGEVPVSLFLSSGVADQMFADALDEALSEVGIRALMSGDDPTMEPPELSKAHALEDATRAVFVLSDKQSPWLNREISQARSYNIPITAIMISGNAEVPEQLRNYEGSGFIKADDSQDITSMARDVAEQIRNNM